MTEELATTLVVIAGVCALFWLIFDGLPKLIHWLGGRAKPVPIDRPLPQPESECHPAPDDPFTVPQARIVMQKLIRCDAERCDCKAAALRVLFEAGLMKPARAIR
ncbi:hypothetical protein [Nocardia sp. NPDC004750]